MLQVFANGGRQQVVDSYSSAKIKEGKGIPVLGMELIITVTVVSSHSGEERG